MRLEPLLELHVVDLFAGSGALGIEALSRGASFVDFVESASAARRVLESNLAALGLSNRARVWPLELPWGLKRMREVLRQAELILLDPPYGGMEARGTLDALGEELLAPRIRLIVEHHAKDVLPDRAGALERSGQRRYGETVISEYRADKGDVSHEAEEEA